MTGVKTFVIGDELRTGRCRERTIHDKFVRAAVRRHFGSATGSR